MSQKWVKSIRTAIQCLIALTSVTPFLIPALGLSATVGVGATLVTISALVTRLTHTPVGEKVLQSLNLHVDSDQS